MRGEMNSLTPQQRQKRKDRKTKCYTKSFAKQTQKGNTTT